MSSARQELEYGSPGRVCLCDCTVWATMCSSMCASISIKTTRTIKSVANALGKRCGQKKCPGGGASDTSGEQGQEVIFDLLAASHVQVTSTQPKHFIIYKAKGLIRTTDDFLQAGYKWLAPRGKCTAYILIKIKLGNTNTQNALFEGHFQTTDDPLGVFKPPYQAPGPRHARCKRVRGSC